MADQNLMRGKGKENCFPELHNHHLTVIRLALHPERFRFEIGPPIFLEIPLTQKIWPFQKGAIVQGELKLKLISAVICNIVLKKVTIVLFKRRCFIV